MQWLRVPLAGLMLLLMPLALPPDEAERRLDAAYSNLRRGPATVDADVFLCFALASLELAGRSSRPPLHYQRAFEVAEVGASAGLDASQAKPHLRLSCHRHRRLGRHLNCRWSFRGPTECPLARTGSS